MALVVRTLGFCEMRSAAEVYRHMRGRDVVHSESCARLAVGALYAGRLRLANVFAKRIRAEHAKQASRDASQTDLARIYFVKRETRRDFGTLNEIWEIFSKAAPPRVSGFLICVADRRGAGFGCVVERSCE